MMKYYVACMLVLCVSSGLMAQDKKSPPSNYKHLKPLEFIVGDWQAEVPTDKDVPGLFKKGEMLTLKLSVRWVENKNAMTSKFQVLFAGKKLEGFHGLIGWSAAKKSVVSGSFNSNGSAGMAGWTNSDNRWVIRGQGVEIDGTATSEDLILSEIKKNSFVSQSTNRRKGDKEMPDGNKVTWKRVKVASNLPKLQGVWEGKILIPESTGKLARMTKEINGNNEVVTYFDEENNVLRKHHNQFRLSKNDNSDVWTFFNGEILEGPKKGEKFSGPGSYIYRLTENNIHEIHGFRNVSANAGQPVVIVWTRSKN